MSMRILAYHEISDEPADPVHNVRPAAFREQMQWLADRGYVTGNLGEQTSSPKTFGIMFEDGYQDVYSEAWPVLEALGFTATAFIITRRVGNVAGWYAGEKEAALMDWHQIQEMSKHGFQFGSHTCTHPVLTSIDGDLLTSELQVSRQQLEDELGMDVTLFSYPFSQADANTARHVHEAGYRSTFRFSPFHPGRGPDRYGAFRGTGILSYDDLETFERKVLGSPRRWVDWRLRQLRALLKGRSVPDC